MCLSWRVDSVGGPVFELAAAGHRLHPRRPQQRRHRGRDRGGDSCAVHAGAQCRRGRRDGDRAALRGHPACADRRRGCPRRRGVSRRHHPLSTVSRRRDRRPTAGLVGLGAVGRALRWRLEGLGVSVIAHDPYSDDARHSLDELLAEADVVSLHAPVTDDTVGMIGAEQFAAMRDGVVFLNTARAQLHDTDALVDALQQRQGCRGGPGPLRGRMAARRPSADRHAERGADAAYRRGHVEH